MATFTTFFKRSDAVRPSAATRTAGVAQAIIAQDDPYRLRPMPFDDLVVIVKKFDNRVVRQHDTEERGRVWSAVASVAVAAAFVGASVVWPGIAAREATSEIEKLKTENRSLLDQRRELSVQRAALESPGRLNAMASAQRLSEPTRDQVRHLDIAADTHVASNVEPTTPRAAR